MAAVGPLTAEEFWRQTVQQWYPRYNQRPYLIPPVFMNKTQFQAEQFAGQTVHVPQRPVSNLPRLPRGAARPVVPPLLESDVRDDSALVKVLRCLQEMPDFEREVMFVISQLDFGDYLNQPCYAAAASMLPRPIQLISQNQHQGDFDILIIHRLYGILIGEIKAIGDNFFFLSQQQQDIHIAKRVKQAINQLHKADHVIRHIASDLPKQPRIQKTLMLPNVTTARLQSVLASDPLLFVDLCQCLDITQTADPSPLCMTSDTLTNPGQWWQQRMTGAGTDPAMDDQLYLDLVARFTGPASTVRVAVTSLPRLLLDMRTEGQGVAETGWRFTQIVLHPSQLAILNSPERLVYLTGPPGCGKTTVLYLKALDWLRQGKHVQVVSTQDRSTAVSHLIFSQLTETAGSAVTGRHQLQKLHLDEGNKNNKENAVKMLMKQSVNGELHIIADELSTTESCVNGVIQELHQHLSTGLHVWVANIYHRYRPAFMTEVVLNEPLRTPPSVTREVQKSKKIAGDKEVYEYSIPPSPLPCDGPVVRVIVHAGQGHGTASILDCEQCGMDVARLLHDLQVGEQDSPLHYRDVLLLTFVEDFNDTETGPSGEVTRPASGMLRGLRQSGVPVTVRYLSAESGLIDMATGKGPDHVFAANYTIVAGLEKPVVVFVETEHIANDGGVTIGRLFAMSRCTSKLIWIKNNPSDWD